MASTSSGSGAAPTDAPTTQPAGKAKISRAAAEDWPSLQRRCADLDITARDLDLEHVTIEAALAAINSAKKPAAWKKSHLNKLRIKETLASQGSDSTLPGANKL